MNVDVVVVLRLTRRATLFAYRRVIDIPTVLKSAFIVVESYGLLVLAGSDRSRELTVEGSVVGVIRDVKWLKTVGEGRVPSRDADVWFK